MTPAKRLQALRDRGLSLAAVGRRMRPTVSRTTVQAVNQELPGRSSRRVRDAITRAIGLPENVVWSIGTTRGNMSAAARRQTSKKAA